MARSRVASTAVSLFSVPSRDSGAAVPRPGWPHGPSWVAFKDIGGERQRNFRQIAAGFELQESLESLSFET